MKLWKNENKVVEDDVKLYSQISICLLNVHILIVYESSVSLCRLYTVYPRQICWAQLIIHQRLVIKQINQLLKFSKKMAALSNFSKAQACRAIFVLRAYSRSLERRAHIKFCKHCYVFHSHSKLVPTFAALYCSRWPYF